MNESYHIPYPKSIPAPYGTHSSRAKPKAFPTRDLLPVRLQEGVLIVACLKTQRHGSEFPRSFPFLRLLNLKIVVHLLFPFLHSPQYQQAVIP